MQNKSSVALFLIILAAIFIYSPSLKNQFIWDDFHLVVNDENVKSFKNLPVVFKTHLYGKEGGSNFYRPVQVISFMIDYRIWKTNPLGYHLTNLFFHLLSIILVYFFISRIFSPDAGLLASLMFAVHPINTEAVTYIAGRADPISTFFFLAALLLYIRFKAANRPGLLFLSVASFAVSLLTKEAVLIFPLVLILYDVLISAQRAADLKSMRPYAPYFLVSLVYILVRFFILGFPSRFMSHAPLGLLIANASKILILYLGLLIFPLHLHMERIGPVIYSLREAQTLIYFMALMCVLGFSVILYRRSKASFFCASFFIITLLPMMNILSINAFMAEHWLYVPSIGIYGLIAFWISRAVDFKKPILRQGASAALIIIIFIGFMGLFSVRTVFRNVEWGRPFEFFKNLLRYSPNSTRAHVNMGTLYAATKNNELARREFQIASGLDPTNGSCYYNIGVLDYADGKKEEARKNWRRALEVAPFNWLSRNAMGFYLRKENKRFKNLLRAIKAHPDSVMAHYRLSKVYWQNGLYPEAIIGLDRVLELDPNYTDAIFNRAWAYSNLGLYTKAIQEYEKVLDLTPDDPDIYKNLGYCYAGLRRYSMTKKVWQKASELLNKQSNPANP